MRVYYAHCQAIYDTPQELRDIQILQLLGLEVCNPNLSVHVKTAKEMKARGENAMDYFLGLVNGCDVVAFRALPDGRIPSGVAKEVQYGQSKGKIIIELPSGLMRRTIGVDETREYLAEVGQR